MLHMITLRNTVHLLPILLLLPAIFLPHQVDSLPLTTKGRWIVDAATGQRVKLRCVNWPGHMMAVIPEGLNQKPVAELASKIAGLGFNCVRLTYSIHMLSKPYYQSLTVSQSLSSLNLTEAVAGVKQNNPALLEAKVIEAFDAVVGALGDAGVMVILDNHVSKPMWCCGMEDGNGFFGDLYFDPEEWRQGLQTMAKRFKGVKQVIGLSMRNELRGHNSSQEKWYEHMTKGANTIHATNPDVLVIVSGLNYDADLSFLKTKPFPAQNEKTVFEAHWYAFSEGKPEEWTNKNPNWVCPGVTQRFNNRIGYLMRSRDNGSTPEAPLFISEFGYDQRGVDFSGDLFIGCFLSFAAERDVDWAMWALQGSYYLRDGVPGFEETYGVLNKNWERPKDPYFQVQFGLILEMIQDPSSKVQPYHVIYHPLTGMCLWADENKNNVQLRDCKYRSRWSHGGDGTPLRLANTSLCLRVEGDGLPVSLSANCSDGQSLWRAPPGSGYQLAGVGGANGTALCMDYSNVNEFYLLLTKQCVCLQGELCPQTNPQVQWFRTISSNTA